ncbi:hypothetical protein BVG19_g303 [[Candida] boidinii]|nr:hypothetical protein BVG19_g303 [[Candida] boidinii]OWB52576.1 hypothetical protein B5S27_g4153 [[Candida] boidinii]
MTNEDQIDEDFDNVLNDQLGLSNIDSMFDGSTHHAADAIDFSDEEELADDDLPEEEISSAMKKKKEVADNATSDYIENNNNSTEESQHKEEAAEEEKEEEEEEEEEEDDDLMKELQAEAMEGVDEEEAGDFNAKFLFDNALPGGLQDDNQDSSLKNMELRDLDFEDGVLNDDDADDDIFAFNQMKEQQEAQRMENQKNEVDDKTAIPENDEEQSSKHNKKGIKSAEKQRLKALKIEQRKEKERQEELQIDKLLSPAEQRRQLKRLRDERERKKRQKILKVYYPLFARNEILNMQYLFPIDSMYYQYQEPPPAKPLIPTKLNFEVDIDQKKLFNMPHKMYQQFLKEQYNNNRARNTKFMTEQRIIEITSQDLLDIEPVVVKPPKVKERIDNYDRDLILSTTDWNDDAIINCGSSDTEDNDHTINVKELTANEKDVNRKNLNIDDSSEVEDDNDLVDREFERLYGSKNMQEGTPNTVDEDEVEENKRAVSKIEAIRNEIINEEEHIEKINSNYFNSSLSKKYNSKRLGTENFDLDGWDEYDDDMFIEGKLNLESINLSLDMNDRRLLFSDETKDDEIKNRKKKNKANFLLINGSDHVNVAEIPTNEKSLELRYGVSNDKDYDILKQNYQTKIRATIGGLNIDHSLPAIRLQSPHYRVRLPKKNLRNFHRNPFIVRPNTTIVFSKIKNRKRKKDRGKEVKDLFKKTTDLTLGDSAQFFMMEYSEECPVNLNNFGMGSKIVNYYRKKDEDDNSRPKLAAGETHVLDVQDRSPFWNFGFVEPGNIVPTLYNRVIRAPIFKHDPLSTDFLLIRSTGGGSSHKYFLRSINQIFAVGQTFPVVDVPGPHSRKVTATSKNRLKMIAYRVLNGNERHRLVVKDISEHFPDQNDMQNRQRLKEFMEYQRQGEDQGFWKVKANEKLPNFEETRNMIKPEDISLLESMHVGQLRLDDLDSFRREKFDGNGNQTTTGANSNAVGTPTATATSTNSNSNANKDNTIEEPLVIQMAPWNTTRNFINATQGKAMLQIYGIGDPSSKGEAISFLRISMKGGFLKSTAVSNPNENDENSGDKDKVVIDKKTMGGHSYNVALQQKMYDEEISKVWYAQQRSLSQPRSTDKPRVIAQEEMDDTKYLEEAKKLVEEEVNETKPRYLKIIRMVRDENGILQRKVQIITDSKVVELYLKKKQEALLDDPTEIDPNKIVLTNDTNENDKMKKKIEEEIQRLTRITEKKNKKKAASGITAANIDSEGRISGKGIGKGKSTSRKCATCGALGHIRTNKACPLYYTAHNKSNPHYVPGSETQSPSVNAGDTPGGSGIGDSSVEPTPAADALATPGVTGVIDPVTSTEKETAVDNTTTKKDVNDETSSGNKLEPTVEVAPEPTEALPVTETAPTKVKIEDA